MEKISPEYYAASQEVYAGDIVSIDVAENETVKKAGVPYDSTILGIVSTSPAIAINNSSLNLGVNSSERDPVKPLIALVGRVPVNVSTENGAIKIGDYITASSTPGIGMKATQPGRVVGIALQSYDGTQEEQQITVFVNPHWSLGALDEEGYLAGGDTGEETETGFAAIIKTAIRSF